MIIKQDYGSSGFGVQAVKDQCTVMYCPLIGSDSPVPGILTLKPQQEAAKLIKKVSFTSLNEAYNLEIMKVLFIIIPVKSPSPQVLENHYPVDIEGKVNCRTQHGPNTLALQAKMTDRSPMYRSQLMHWQAFVLFGVLPR